MVILDYLKKLWNFVSNLTSETKTIIIFVLLILGLNPIYRNYYEETLIESVGKAFHLQREQTLKEEDYGFKSAPYVAQCIDNIKDKDVSCNNVLLLSYHNTKHSLQSFSYIYLDCIRESVKSQTDDYVGDYWQSLQYINYQEELNKINDISYLQVDDIEKIKYTFPRFYKKLQQSNAKAVGIYPIEGIRNPIGLIVVMYESPKNYSPDYYKRVISPQIQKLSTILDNTVNENDNEN